MTGASFFILDKQAKKPNPKQSSSMFTAQRQLYLEKGKGTERKRKIEFHFVQEKVLSTKPIALSKDYFYVQEYPIYVDCTNFCKTQAYASYFLYETDSEADIFC